MRWSSRQVLNHQLTLQRPAYKHLRLLAQVTREQPTIKIIANKAEHAVSAEAKVRQNDADDDHETDNIDDGIHAVPLITGGLFCAPDM